MNLSEQILSDYSTNTSLLNGFAGSRFQEIRETAFDSFQNLQFPTTKNEEWKYTNVQSLLSLPFSPTDTQLTSVDEFKIPELDCITIVLVNGKFSQELSDDCSGLQGISISSLHKDYTTFREQIDTHLGTAVLSNLNAFTAANTATMNDGTFVSVHKNTIIEKPVYILSIIDAAEHNTLIQPRHLIVCGENSQSTIIFRTITLGSNVSLTNQVIECIAERTAISNCYVVQDDIENANMINTHNTLQDAKSIVNIITVSLSGGIIRNTVGTKLNEQHSEAHMFGLYITNGKTHVDNHTVMDHSVANCHSNELYKGILDGNSQGVFNGKIFVREDAQKTLAYQSNRNILLSNTATVNTKPQLEIWADDVKCSHGCTIGQLDEESLFYLRARGISEQKAKALLLTAFAEDITEKITLEPLRNFINAKIEQRLIQ